MTDVAPTWLITARVLKGTLEAPGAADNPVILTWPAAIARRWPEMSDYTRGYTHDAIAWCGLFVAYCLSANGIRPPFGASDTDKFLWANSYSRWGTQVGIPQLGDVCVFTRNGGGHVAFYEGTDGDHYLVTGGNQSDSVSTTRHSKDSLTGFFRPPAPEKLPLAGNIPIYAPAPSVPSQRFETCLKTTLKWEGGNDDDPRDPGGRTSRGILQREWDSWRQSHPGLPSDVWQAPQDQIVAIYKQKYWDRCLCDQMPSGVDLAVFDFAVNSGGAIKVIQRTLGVDADGEVGPVTLTALRAEPAAQLITDICDDRMMYLHGLGVWPTFGKGWTSRVNDVRATALAQVGAKPMEPTPVTEPTTTLPAAPQIDLNDLAERIATKVKNQTPEQKQAWGALFMAGIKAVQIAFPQFAVFGSLAQFMLASAGFMGTPVGDAVTTTGQVTGVTMVSLLASWAVSKINKMAK